MRVTLFWYIWLFSDWNLPRLWSGHSRASGPCSQVPKLCIYGGSGEIFSRAVCEQDFAGNRNPQGGGAEAEERVAAGRMRSPERCPNQGRANASENTGTRQISLGLPASQSTAHRS